MPRQIFKVQADTICQLHKQRLQELSYESGVDLPGRSLAVGSVYTSSQHPLDAEQIREFARCFDPQPFHLDEDAARDTFFAGLAASGWHTAAITMKLLVESLPLAGGVVGAGREITWPRPTRAEDVLQVVSTESARRTVSALCCAASCVQTWLTFCVKANRLIHERSREAVRHHPALE